MVYHWYKILILQHTDYILSEKLENILRLYYFSECVSVEEPIPFIDEICKKTEKN